MAKTKSVLLGIINLGVLCILSSEEANKTLQPAWFKPLIGDQEVAEELQRRPDLINTYTKDGYTGLHLAVIRGDLTQVVAFVESGADINLPVINKSIQNGDTPLILSIFGVNLQNNIKMPFYLIDKKADVLKSNIQGTAPIHQLLWITDHNLRMEIAKKLIVSGADINAQTKQGNTMLHLAVEKYDKKWIDMVKKVFGSSLNFTIKNNDGLTPLELARKLQQLGDDSVVSSLLSEYEVLGEGWGGYAKTNKLGQTGLMLAITRNDPSFVTKMIKRGANVNAQDKNGRTALFYAVESDNPELYVAELLAHGAKVEIHDAKGQTALMLVPAIDDSKKRIDTARLLINAGIDVDARDLRGNTVWHYASKALDHGLISFLKKEAGVVHKNKQGETALDIVRSKTKGSMSKHDKDNAQKTLQALSV